MLCDNIYGIWGNVYVWALQPITGSMRLCSDWRDGMHIWERGSDDHIEMMSNAANLNDHKAGR
jgi:hypothetical protein